MQILDFWLDKLHVRENPTKRAKKKALMEQMKADKKFYVNRYLNDDQNIRMYQEHLEFEAALRKALDGDPFHNL
jgi:hypothetical protein